MQRVQRMRRMQHMKNIFFRPPGAFLGPLWVPKGPIPARAFLGPLGPQGPHSSPFAGPGARPGAGACVMCTYALHTRYNVLYAPRCGIVQVQLRSNPTSLAHLHLADSIDLPAHLAGILCM